MGPLAKCCAHSRDARLAATAEGIAARPMNQPAEMMDRNQMLGRTDVSGPALTKLADAQGWKPTFTFRLRIAEREAPPSPRRPQSDVLRAYVLD